MFLRNGPPVLASESFACPAKVAMTLSSSFFTRLTWRSHVEVSRGGLTRRFVVPLGDCVL